MSAYNIINETHLTKLHAIASEIVFTDADSLQHYAHDETENLSFAPHAVLKPTTVNSLFHLPCVVQVPD
jgi:glycolate oxidase